MILFLARQGAALNILAWKSPPTQPALSVIDLLENKRHYKLMEALKHNLKTSQANSNVNVRLHCK